MKNLSKTMKQGLIIAIIVNIAFLASLFVCVFCGYDDPQFSIFITAVMFAYHTDVRIIIGVTISLFAEHINIESGKYKVSQNEFNRLNKLGLKKWKDRFVALDKRQFIVKKDENTEKNIKIILKNNIKAEIIHWICFFASFVSILIGCLLSVELWYVYVLTALIASFVCDLPPILIQRYNRYRLQKILNKHC